MPSTCHQSYRPWCIRLLLVESVEQRLEWHQGQEVVACWPRCSDRDRSLRHRSRQTCPFVVEQVVVREGYPWKGVSAEQPEVVVAEQLSELEVEER
jgi:hypothetical protein